MIIRGTPKNKDNYILVDSETTLVLHSNGFIPMYIDENGVYYKKNKEILEFMDEGKNTRHFSDGMNCRHI